MELLNKARNSTSNFCLYECKALCCRSGFLPLTDIQLKCVVKDIDELKKLGVVRKLSDGRWAHNNNIFGCQQLLNDLKCNIYTNKDRPQCCNDYPILQEGNTLKIVLRCPAARKGLFDKFIPELEELGYNVKKVK